MIKKENALIVFAREPEPGKVKTRLLTEYDAGFVTGLYCAFIEDVMNVAVGTGGWTPRLYFAGNGPGFLDRYRPHCDVVPQRGADLGERMYNAAADCFRDGYRRVVIIGTDCPDITAADVTEAFQNLTAADFCLGPCRDGGYYLVGMRRLRREPFTGVAWGTETVLSKTLEIIAQIKHNVILSAEKEDIDTPASLRNFAGRMEDSPEAPISKQYLRERLGRLSLD